MLFITKSSAILALASSAAGHLIMQNPIPFDWEDAATKQSPLAPADFPCKQPTGKYAVVQMNKWNPGETQSVKIIGGATHGGGSCQFSITTDAKPTKQSQWKVIHSVIGNCPGGPDDNNLSSNPNDDNIPGIPVTMPADIPAGQYTFAWSWNNKIGNREFYMNCAPIMVGSASKRDTTASANVAQILGKLPDMFVVNLPATECSNTAFEDTAYPNPGDSVSKGPTAKPGLHLTGSGCATQNKMGAGAGKIGSPAQASGAPAASQPAVSAAPSNPGGVFAPGASSVAAAPTNTPIASPVAPAPSQPAASQPAAPSTPNTPVNGSGACTPCSNEGGVVCMSSKQFGLCNFGCAVAQDVALGMTCTNGAVVRRSINFPRAHYHRRHSSGLLRW